MLVIVFHNNKNVMVHAAVESVTFEVHLSPDLLLFEHMQIIGKSIVLANYENIYLQKSKPRSH